MRRFPSKTENCVLPSRRLFIQSHEKFIPHKKSWGRHPIFAAGLRWRAYNCVSALLSVCVFVLSYAGTCLLSLFRLHEVSPWLICQSVRLSLDIVKWFMLLHYLLCLLIMNTNLLLTYLMFAMNRVNLRRTFVNKSNSICLTFIQAIHEMKSSRW